jgi:hypothetical protein
MLVIGETDETTFSFAEDVVFAADALLAAAEDPLILVPFVIVALDDSFKPTVISVVAFANCKFDEVM